MKYLEDTLFVPVERVLMAESALSNTQMGVVRGMWNDYFGNAVLQSNRLT